MGGFMDKAKDMTEQHSGWLAAASAVTTNVDRRASEELLRRVRSSVHG